MKPKPNIENYLLNKKFTIDTRHCDTKVYRRNINDKQTLYVMIFADVNKLVAVDYEDTEDQSRKITLETVNTYEKLKKLVEAIF